MHHTSTHCCESPHLSMKKKHMLNSRFWTNSQTRLNPITAWASPISFSVKWRGILPLMESQFTTDQVKFLWQSVGTHSYSWMERGAERSIVIHLTWPSPTHSSLAPSLHFVRFPEPISPLGRRQTLKDWCFVQEHKPMKQPGLESSFSIGESKQSLEG